MYLLFIFLCKARTKGKDSALHSKRKLNLLLLHHFAGNIPVLSMFGTQTESAEQECVELQACCFLGSL